MKKALSIFLVLCLFVSCFATSASASGATEPISKIAARAMGDIEEDINSVYFPQTWITGRFNGNNYSGKTSLYVKNSGSWSSPKFKVYTYNANGQQTSGKIIIRVTTPQDRNYVKTYYVSSGNTITLQKGYSHYYIQICRYGYSSSNVIKTYNWAYKATQNSYF